MKHDWATKQQNIYLQSVNIFSISYKLIDFSYIDKMNADSQSPTPISNT